MKFNAIIILAFCSANLAAQLLFPVPSDFDATYGDGSWADEINLQLFPPYYEIGFGGQATELGGLHRTFDPVDFTDHLPTAEGRVGLQVYGAGHMAPGMLQAEPWRFTLHDADGTTHSADVQPFSLSLAYYWVEFPVSTPSDMDWTQITGLTFSGIEGPSPFAARIGQISVVPEPHHWALMSGFSLLAWGCARRRALQ